MEKSHIVNILCTVYSQEQFIVKTLNMELFCL